jgi:transcriptional regulator with XRE-family HTH domain
VDLPGLRRARLDRLLTQRELAAKAGLTQATVQRIETGATKARISTVRKLAAALGVEPRQLIASQDDEPKEEP